ncbi:MAG: AAA family ATPase [Bradymonadales bacterium]|nr:AAA family ATPase [Bradymonadales bacterium]
MNPENLSQRSRSSLTLASEFAKERKHGRVEPEHLLLALVCDPNGATAPLLEQLGVDPRLVEHRLLEELSRPDRVTSSRPPTSSMALNSVLDAAKREAQRQQSDRIKTEHLLTAIADGPPSDAVRILKAVGVTRDTVNQLVRQARGDAKSFSAEERPTSPYTPIGGSTEARPSAPNPLQPVTSPSAGARLRRPPLRPRTPEKPLVLDLLNRFGIDLTAAAQEGRLDPVIGREEEIRRLMQVLSRRTKNNPVLVGEPGVGKTAIVEGFAQRLVGGDVPAGLKGRRIFSLEMGSLVAGTSLRGQLEERLKGIVNEVIDSQGQVILFVDEIHTLVGSSSQESSTDTGGMFKPALARGEIRMIGTTTPDEFRKRIERDPALERRFQTIHVQEPDFDKCMAILRGIKSRYEIHHGVRISDAALAAAVRLSTRYVSSRALPDKAIDLIDEAASRLRLSIDSMPPEIDSARRRIANLEIEKTALTRETTSEAIKERKAIEEEIGRVAASVETLIAQWESEKAELDKFTNLKQELAAAEKLVAEAQRAGDTGRLAELKYGVLTEIKRQLDAQGARLAEIQSGKRLVREEVEDSDIAEIVSHWTGIPVAKMMEGERERLLRMEDTLRQRVVGQDTAIHAVTAAVRRARAGLKDPGRPIGNFFFVGPTGVGKTELAKALAEFLFDTEKAIVRIDMSEYMEQSKVNTLIGSPLGYVDSDKGGVLTEPVRLRPYSVVLFDEAEKAHPEVFNILLQVLDEGRLSDSQGREVSFANTIVIMTSNVGSRKILDMSGKLSHEEMEQQIHLILRDHFKPEFLNRLDDIVVFHALNREALDLIVQIMLNKVRQLLAEQKMAMEVTEAAKNFLTEEGYEPEYGARPLKRAILTYIQDPLSLAILERKFVPGDTVVVDLPEGDSHPSFSKKERTA